LSAESQVVAFKRMRDRPLWSLLGAQNGPIILGVLFSLLMENEKVLHSSVLHERLGRELEILRRTYDLPQTAQGYIANWLSNGWLTRRLPAGAQEEEYELSADAVTALRFVEGQLTPRSAATESRLVTVIQQFSRLAQETDSNPRTQIAALEAERARIDREIDAVRARGVKPIPEERALERVREILALAQELTADFRRVRDEFDKLNRQLRKDLLEYEGSRGDLLEKLFAGVDVIAESDAGRTFDAFFRLLTDVEQSSVLRESVSNIISRPFARELETRERRLLLSLTSMLSQEGSGVHEVMQNLARSLRGFVKSREYAEHRRLNGLLRAAQGASLELKDQLAPNAKLPYALMQSTSRLGSVSQWSIYDPSERAVDTAMPEAEEADISTEAVLAMIRESEIDFRGLKGNIRAVLAGKSQASIGELLNAYPADQGFGSVVGYIALGVEFGEVADSKESVHWVGKDDVVRRARIPTIYFMQEKLGELVD